MRITGQQPNQPVTGAAWLVPAEGHGGIKMTCKDCIHYDVCLIERMDVDDKETADGLFVQAEHDCAYFVDRNLFVRLPCKVGDTVYEPRCHRGFIQEYTVISIHISNCGNLYGWKLKDGKGIYSNQNGFSEHAIGKSVFLTHEEAAAALKGDKNEAD